MGDENGPSDDSDDQKSFVDVVWSMRQPRYRPIGVVFAIYLMPRGVRMAFGTIILSK